MQKQKKTKKISITKKSLIFTMSLLLSGFRRHVYVFRSENKKTAVKKVVEIQERRRVKKLVVDELNMSGVKVTAATTTMMTTTNTVTWSGTAQ